MRVDTGEKCGSVAPCAVGLSLPAPKFATRHAGCAAMTSLALPWKTRREGELVEARSTATETISDIGDA